KLEAITYIVLHAATIFCCFGLSRKLSPWIKGSNIGLASFCRSLIQPLLHLRQTHLTRRLWGSPSRSSRSTSECSSWTSARTDVWRFKSLGTYSLSYVGQTSSLLTRLHPG